MGKILITIEDDLLKIVDEEVKRLGLDNRSLVIRHILRKHLNLPNLFENQKTREMKK